MSKTTEVENSAAMERHVASEPALRRCQRALTRVGSRGRDYVNNTISSSFEDTVGNPDEPSESLPKQRGV